MESSTNTPEQTQIKINTESPKQSVNNPKNETLNINNNKNIINKHENANISKSNNSHKIKTKETSAQTLTQPSNNNLSLKIFIISGLLFGDEGKGTTVEFLAHKKNANLVIRYGGGPQAAHHIVLQNGLFHCFSQLGSASFLKSSGTLLSKYMIINPITLQREIEVLSKKGISEAEILNKLFIDEACFLITPYHKLINVVKEILRCKANHGSTGLGVGVAIDDAMYKGERSFFPKAQVCFEKEKQIEADEKENRNFAYFNCDAAVIQVKDFYERNLLFRKLKMLVEEKINHVEFLIDEYYENNGIDKDLNLQANEEKCVAEVRSTLEKFKAEFSLVNLLKIYYDWFDKFRKHGGIFVENSAKFILDYCLNFTQKENLNLNTNFNEAANVIFEGSQGALLDRIYGFYPHITKTLCSAENAEALINEIKSLSNHTINVEACKLGVLRVYSSRHGKGPFVAESEYWSANVVEMHNDFGRFQGAFRLGPFDLVAARYGVQIFKPDFLSLTCVDRIVEKIKKENFIFGGNGNYKDVKDNENNEGKYNKDKRDENYSNYFSDNDLVAYDDKIDKIDFYFCEFYFLDYLKDEIADENKSYKIKNSNKKNKNEKGKLNIQRIDQYFAILNELKHKGIFETIEFESIEKLEEFLIERTNFYNSENKILNDKQVFVKKYIINLRKTQVSCYSENNFKLILITKINKGDDFYNFKNNKLAKILEKGKGVYYKFYLNQVYLGNFTDDYDYKTKENLKLIDYEKQNANVETFFESKLSKYTDYVFSYVYKNILNFEKELKIPIKVLSLGATKEDKILLEKFDFEK